MSGAPAVEPRAGRWLRCAAWAALALPFVLNLDAQWLKLDDISMTEMLRGPSPGRLVGDIVLTRTTPHVRFAFLYHLVLAPFFRGWFESRAAVNAFFLATVGALLLAGAVLARPLRPRPAAWLGAVGLYATAVLSGRTWSTLEFKTATYLPAAFCLAVATLAVTRLLSGAGAAPRGLVALWAVAAVASFHTAEMTLVAVVVLGAALVARGRLPWPVLAGVAAWPFAFWALNMAIAPRPLGLAGAAGGGVRPLEVLLGAARMAQRHLGPEAIVGLATFGVALAILASGRPFRQALGDALEILAFPAAAAAMLLVTELRSPGYSDDRYLCFQQLCIAAGAAIALGSLVRRAGPRWATVAAVAACGFAAWHLSLRIPALFKRADARRDELESTFAMQRTLRAHLDTRLSERAAREVIVFVGDWRTEVETGVGLDSTFLGAPWSQGSFGRAYVCGLGRTCPSITFRPNATWLRTTLTREERAELCRKIPGSDIFLEEDRRLGPRPVELAAPAGPACADWLVSRGLVRAAEEVPRSP